MQANPSWDEEERALALELYLRRGMASKTDPEVAHLSALLNQRARQLGIAASDNFRNPAGVALKLANFAALDPSYPGRGMTRYSRGDAATWEELAGDSDYLARKVDAIVGGLQIALQPRGVPLLPLEDDSTSEYVVSIDAAVRFARRREAHLVQKFGDHLRSQGRTVGTHHHSVDSGTLRVDLVDETDKRIWEAKYEVGRNAVRLAIGQLADYRRFEPASWGTGILLPRRPSDDLLSLCGSVKAAVAWPTARFESFEILQAS